MNCLRIINVFFGIFLAAQYSSSNAQTHCTKDEIDYFSCKLAGSNKIASLCGANESGHLNGGWLQYRFGKPRQIEFKYPEIQDGSLRKFEASHFSKYNYLTVLFINEKALYEIEVSEGVSKKNLIYTAVINVEFEKKRTTLHCSKPISESYWAKLIDLTPYTFKYSGDGKDSFLWQYHNKIAK